MNEHVQKISLNADKSKPEKRMGKDGRFYTVKSKKSKNNSRTKKDATAKKPSSLPESPTSEIQQMIQANAKELQIVDTISLLASQIDAWFEIAPDEEYEKFDLRIRKRILELVD